MAKENLDIDNPKEPLEMKTTIAILEGAQESENEPKRKTREARNKKTTRTHRRQTNCRGEKKIRRYEEIRGRQKKRSILFLALGAEGKRVFAQKHPRVKVLAIYFKEIFDLIETAFIKSTNISFERYKPRQVNKYDKIINRQ